jgi:hypothetical protein
MTSWQRSRSKTIVVSPVRLRREAQVQVVRAPAREPECDAGWSDCTGSIKSQINLCLHARPWPTSIVVGTGEKLIVENVLDQYFGEEMLREIVVEEEMPGDRETTFRLRIDENVIAENVTELESQFLISEILERFPSLRSASKATPSSGREGIRPVVYVLKERDVSLQETITQRHL